jgi:hypothetical protein
MNTMANLRGHFISAAAPLAVFDMRFATRMLCDVANAANELPCMWESGKTDKSKHLSFTAPTEQHKKVIRNAFTQVKHQVSCTSDVKSNIRQCTPTGNATAL